MTAARATADCFFQLRENTKHQHDFHWNVLCSCSERIVLRQSDLFCGREGSETTSSRQPFRNDVLETRCTLKVEIPLTMVLNTISG